MGLALGFSTGALAYQFCDDLAIVAKAWIDEDMVGDPDGFSGYPDLFLRVYDAFDEGEFVHPGDPGEVDPVEKYTRPAIMAAVRDFPGS